MIIVPQVEYDCLAADKQKAILLLGEHAIQADWAPQPVRAGYRGPILHVRVVAVRLTRMGQLTDADALLLNAPSLAACRAYWNQHHPVCNRWHANRVCTLLRVVNNGPPVTERQPTVFDLLKEAP